MAAFAFGTSARQPRRLGLSSPTCSTSRRSPVWCIILYPNRACELCSAALGSDFEISARGRYSSSWDGCVCVFDPASAIGTAVASISAHAGPVYEVAVSGSDNSTVIRLGAFSTSTPRAHCVQCGRGRHAVCMGHQVAAMYCKGAGAPVRGKCLDGCPVAL